MAKKADIPCPRCGSDRHKVINSRVFTDYRRRRRECVCGHRYTTVERVAATPKAGQAFIPRPLTESEKARLLRAARILETAARIA